MDFLENEEMYEDGSELNEKIAAAGAILEKTASDEGVDLNDFSDEEIGELVGEIISEQDKVASQTITVADVAVELAKVAAAEGIDLDSISRDDYTQAFDALAEQLTDPDVYAQKVAAEQEQLAKIAEAEEAGRVMARAFTDELGTLDKLAKAGVILDASGNVIKSTLRQRAAASSAGKAVTKGTNAARSIRQRIGDAAESAGRRTVHNVGGATSTVGKKIKPTSQRTENLRDRIFGAGWNTMEGARNMSRGQAQAVTGALGTAGVGTVGAAGYGAKKVHDRRKAASNEEFEAQALEIAQEYVDKLASDDAVYERAAEILAENGYEIAG